MAAVGVNDADLHSCQPCCEEDRGGDPTADLSRLLDVPAMQHLISNTSEGFASAMPSYTKVVDGGILICRLCGRKDKQARLLSTCCDGPRTRHMGDPVRKFKRAIYKK